MNLATKPDWLATLPRNVVQTLREDAEGPLLLVCEHAARFIPEGLGDLGLGAAEARSHIAWDPGAMRVATHLSALQNSTLISQKISRLVYDCNRPPTSPQAIRDESEIYHIPGNANLGEADRAARTTHVYQPFRQALADHLDHHARRALVTIHSFTPVYNGKSRAVEIGILHDSDSRMADAMLKAASQNPAYKVGRNDPYGPEDGVTHTLTEHALPRGLLNVMIEIRNDLIATPESQQAVATWLSEIITSALKTFPVEAKCPE